MRTSPATLTLAICLATSALVACGSDDDGDDNDPPKLTANDASVNANNNGLDSSLPPAPSDGGIRDLLGDAEISDFFSDGGINEGAICTRVPQACVDGSVVRPNRDGGMPRGDGGARDGGRPARDGSAADDDGGEDAGGEAGT